MDRALLVIDVDYLDQWDPKSIIDEKDRQRVSLSIEKTIVDARAKSVPIIFVLLDRKANVQVQMQDGERCIGCCGSASQNKLAEFLGHKHGSDFEPVFVKEYNNAFTNKELEPALRLLGIKEVILVGCNTFMCVHETAIGAVKAEFDVTLLSSATYPPFAGVGEKARWIKLVKCSTTKESKVAIS